jgi:hypothetical protein
MNKGVQVVLVCAAVLGAPAVAVSAPTGVEACLALAEDRARLACFDRLFRVSEEGAAPAPAKSRPPASPPPVAELTSPARSEIEAQGQHAVVEEAASPNPTSAPQPVEVAPRSVARLRQTPRGRWIIVLDDGSEWLQLDDRALSVTLGRRVSLRQGLLGGQFMRPEDGAGRSIKVERLR